VPASLWDAGVLPDRPGFGEDHREQGDAVTENLTCEFGKGWEQKTGHLVLCGELATYTFRMNDRVFHLCKKHYTILKNPFEGINDPIE
jgi:hypothetical protein